MLEADLGADVVFGLEEMKTERAAGGEIDLGSAGRSFFVGEEGAAADLEIRSYFSGSGENPLEGEGVYAAAAGCAVFLGDAIEWFDAKGILEATFEKAGAVRGGENQAEAKPDVENAVVHLAAVDAVAATRKDLVFGFAFDWAGLGAGTGCG